MVNIHPTAIISQNVRVEDDVFIGPYCILDGNIEIGSGTKIKSHVNIAGNTKIGKNNFIYPFTSLGTTPQDKKYHDEETFLVIGDNNVIRENVTINRGTKFEDCTTRIGNGNLLMSMTHLAHDCKVGDGVVVSNGAMIAGHVKIDDFAIIGGMSGVHQFCHIGSMSMIGGMSRIRGHVPPFALTKDDAIHGINVVGMKRNSLALSDVKLVEGFIKAIAKHNDVLLSIVTEFELKYPQNSCILNIVKFIKSLPNRNIGLCKFDIKNV